MVEVHKVSGAPYDSNVFLVMDEHPILVDAGMAPEATLRNIAKYIDPKKIEMIVLTHCHHDHTGAAVAIREATGGKLVIDRHEVGALGDDLATLAHMFGRMSPECSPDDILDEGKVLDLGEWKLEVMETPGHSPGSICLYEKNAKVLFSGDTAFPDGNIGRTDLFGGNSEELIQSVERLTKLDVKIMYPGHMEVTDRDVNRQIQLSLRFAKSVL
jgi:hydroxyacylglutathione hydrolase